MATHAPVEGRVRAPTQLNVQPRAQVRAQRRPTQREELANAVTHGFGALLALMAALSLIVLPPMRASSVTIASCIAFCIAALITMGASTAHHASVCERRKRIFLYFDHAGIGLLIAGSWTAFAAVSLPAGDLPPLLVGLWATATVIAVEQFLCWKRDCEPWLEQYSAALFLAMGWIPVAIYGDAVLANLPEESAILLSAGCLFYTSGVIAYVARRVPFHHAIWHTFVVVGAALHFFALRAALA